MPATMAETLPDLRRFITQRAGVNDHNGCWVWLPKLNADGYGVAYWSGRTWGAHRLSWLAHKGEEPTHTIDHLCRNRACVNPAHMEDVPIRVNTLRGNSQSAKNARKTHCKRGHLLGGDNLRLHALRGRLPRRVCRACLRLHARRSYERRKRRLGKESP